MSPANHSYYLREYYHLNKFAKGELDFAGDHERAADETTTSMRTAPPKRAATAFSNSGTNSRHLVRCGWLGALKTTVSSCAVGSWEAGNSARARPFSDGANSAHDAATRRASSWELAPTAGGVEVGTGSGAGA